MNDKDEKPAVYQGLLLYLDQNIYGRMVSPETDIDKIFRKFIFDIKPTIELKIPYSNTHIYETIGIKGKDRDEYVQKHLSLIKELSDSYMIDFREDINEFVIYQRDPFEMFDTITEALQYHETIDDIFNEAKETLNDLEFRKECEEKGINVDLIEQFNPETIKPFLEPDLLYSLVPDSSFVITELGIEKNEINNLSLSEAIDYIDKKLALQHEMKCTDIKYISGIKELFGDMEPITFMKMLNLSLKASNVQINEHIRNICFAQLLESYGYKSNSSCFNKNAFHDHCHYSFSKVAHYFISEDRKLRRKLGANPKNRSSNGNWVFSRIEFIRHCQEMIS